MIDILIDLFYSLVQSGSLPSISVLHQVPEGAGTQTRKTTASPGVPVGQSAGAVSTYQRRLNTCKAELQHLVQQKREQCSAERMAKQMMESAEWESRPPPPGKVVPLGQQRLVHNDSTRAYFLVIILLNIPLEVCFLPIWTKHSRNVNKQ